MRSFQRKTKSYRGPQKVGGFCLKKGKEKKEVWWSWKGQNMYWIQPWSSAIRRRRGNFQQFPLPAVVHQFTLHVNPDRLLSPKNSAVERALAYTRSGRVGEFLFRWQNCEKFNQDLISSYCNLLLQSRVLPKSHFWKLHKLKGFSPSGSWCRLEE